MEETIIAMTRQLLRVFPTLTPCIIWDFGFDRRVSYLAIQRTLAKLAHAGEFECVDPVSLVYRRATRSRAMPHLALPHWDPRAAIGALRRAVKRAVPSPRPAPQPAT